MAHVSICDAAGCRITVDGRLPHCPKCGGPVRHARQVQPRGWVLLIVGLFLTVLMAAVTFYTAPTMLAGQENGWRFDGTPAQATMILILFALVIGFGLGAAIGGLYEILTGQQHPAFLRAIFLLFTALMLAALAIGFVLG
ncbi:hypothetical protein [Sphingosinicella sp. CPCC 101087]|uniref:hypothetical protein n=1 Tax=Sphingosinicella sp. CPCC 101087 TaxID=2497754 RepID=UPI00101C0525|nr:hypothetical protein [Sphingosinicella sp. CPCC 101087]